MIRRLVTLRFTRGLSIFLLLIVFNFVSAQGLHRHRTVIEKCLLITFPNESTRLDTLNMVIYQTKIESNEYQVVFSRAKQNVPHLRQFKIALKGYVEGVTKSKQMSGYHHLILDSTYGGVRGKFITSTKNDSSSGYRHIYNFITNVQGHFYSILCATDCNDQDCYEADVKSFYQSVEFDSSCRNKQLDEEEQYNTFFKIGQQIGRPVLLVLLLVILVVGVIYFRKRK